MELYDILLKDCLTKADRVGHGSSPPADTVSGNNLPEALAEGDFSIRSERVFGLLIAQTTKRSHLRAGDNT